MAAVGSSSQYNKNVTVEVYVNMTSNGTFDLVNRKFTTAATLVTGTHYKFKIQAYNGVGVSAWSQNSARMIAALPPGIPTGLSKLSSTKTQIQI